MPIDRRLSEMKISEMETLHSDVPLELPSDSIIALLIVISIYSVPQAQRKRPCVACFVWRWAVLSSGPHTMLAMACHRVESWVHFSFRSSFFVTWSSTSIIPMTNKSTLIYSCLIFLSLLRSWMLTSSLSQNGRGNIVTPRFAQSNLPTRIPLGYEGLLMLLLRVREAFCPRRRPHSGPKHRLPCTKTPFY